MSGRDVGDFNEDNTVNNLDLNVLLGQWGTEYVLDDLNNLLSIRPLFDLLTCN